MARLILNAEKGDISFYNENTHSNYIVILKLRMNFFKNHGKGECLRKALS